MNFFRGMLLAAGAIMLLGCGNDEAKPKKLRIGIATPSATHGWAGGVVWSAERAKKQVEAANPDVEVFVATGNTTADQVNSIENLLARRLDALVVLCQEPGSITTVCKTAKEQGVYLVVVSNPLDTPIEDHFVNGDNRSMGAAAAEAMGQVLNGQGDILVMEGIPCPINNDRVGAFKKVLSQKYPNIKIIDSQPAWWNTEKGMNLMEVYLQKYPKIDAVWAGDDDVLAGALKAYEESGRTDVKAMIGGGGSKYIVKKIMDKDPVVKATVTYSPRMVEVGVEKALEGLRNGKKPKDGLKETLIPSEIVVPENATEFYFEDSVY